MNLRYPCIINYELAIHARCCSRGHSGYGGKHWHLRLAGILRGSSPIFFGIDLEANFILNTGMKPFYLSIFEFAEGFTGSDDG